MYAKHQFKHKLIKIPIAAATLFLAIAMIMFTQLSTPITVHADSMTEQETPGAASWDNTGITYTHTGWLFYLLYPEDGSPASGVQAILSYDGIIGTETGDWVTNLILVASTGQRYIKYDDIEKNATWGPPFDNDGNFRGDEVRQWLKSDPDGDGHLNAAGVVKQYWGEEAALAWENKDVYLAFEPFFWGRIFKDNISTGKWLCATSSMWGVMMDLYEINETHGDYTYSEEESGRGDSYTRRYTNNVFPNCVTLDDAPENEAMYYTTPTHGGLLENSEMYSEFAIAGHKQKTGYGLGIVWSDKESQTSTYDEPLTTPAPAPDDKEELPYIDQITEGKYANIVKFYEEHHLDTEGNLIEEDTIRAAYTRTPTPRTITIEDEEPVGYTVKEWFTSPTYRRGTLPQNVSIQHLTSF